MKKKKLVLSTETLRMLTENKLEKAVGGQSALELTYCCYSGTRCDISFCICD